MTTKKIIIIGFIGVIIFYLLFVFAHEVLTLKCGLSDTESCAFLMSVVAFFAAGWIFIDDSSDKY